MKFGWLKFDENQHNFVIEFSSVESNLRIKILIPATRLAQLFTGSGVEVIFEQEPYQKVLPEKY